MTAMAAATNQAAALGRRRDAPWSNGLFGTVISLASGALAGVPEVPRDCNERLLTAAA